MKHIERIIQNENIDREKEIAITLAESSIMHLKDFFLRKRKAILSFLICLIISLLTFFIFSIIPLKMDVNTAILLRIVLAVVSVFFAIMLINAFKRSPEFLTPQISLVRCPFQTIDFGDDKFIIDPYHLISNQEEFIYPACDNIDRLKQIFMKYSTELKETPSVFLPEQISAKKQEALGVEKYFLDSNKVMNQYFSDHLKEIKILGAIPDFNSPFVEFVERTSDKMACSVDGGKVLQSNSDNETIKVVEKIQATQGNDLENQFSSLMAGIKKEANNFADKSQTIRNDTINKKLYRSVMNLYRSVHDSFYNCYCPSCLNKDIQGEKGATDSLEDILKALDMYQQKHSNELSQKDYDRVEMLQKRLQDKEVSSLAIMQHTGDGRTFICKICSREYSRKEANISSLSIKDKLVIPMWHRFWREVNTEVSKMRFNFSERMQNLEVEEDKSCSKIIDNHETMKMHVEEKLIKAGEEIKEAKEVFNAILEMSKKMTELSDQRLNEYGETASLDRLNLSKIRDELDLNYDSSIKSIEEEMKKTRKKRGRLKNYNTLTPFERKENFSHILEKKYTDNEQDSENTNKSDKTKHENWEALRNWKKNPNKPDKTIDKEQHSNLTKLVNNFE